MVRSSIRFALVLTQLLCPYEMILIAVLVFVAAQPAAVASRWSGGRPAGASGGRGRRRPQLVQRGAARLLEGGEALQLREGRGGAGASGGSRADAGVGIGGGDGLASGGEVRDGEAGPAAALEL